MGRSSLVLALGLLSLSGCKQLFGPDEAGQGGAANTGGTAAGAGGVGGSGASSMSGGNGGVGGGTGGAGCSFTPASIPQGQCLGAPMPAHPIDGTLFAGGVTSETLMTDQFRFEPCSGFGMGSCGEFSEGNDGAIAVLRATPAASTGYWADPTLKPTPFLYKPMNGAFVVVASVRVHSMAQASAWPAQPINLGGLLARGTGASETCRPPWLKLEVGTLDSVPGPGIRSAWQGLNTPDNEPNQSDVVGTDIVPIGFDTTSTWIDLALCRNSDDGQIRRFYRVPSETSWNEVGMSSAPPAAEMPGAIDIGLVAAAYNAAPPPDVFADFRYVAFHEFTRLCSCAEGLPTVALPTMQ